VTEDVTFFTDDMGRPMVRYDHPDGTAHQGPATTEAEVCDFCFAKHPRWAYPCGVVQIDNHPTIDMSDDDWAACDTCHDLIEAGDVAALAERVYEQQKTMVAEQPNLKMPPHDDVILQFRALFYRFSQARTGAPFVCR